VRGTGNGGGSGRRGGRHVEDERTPALLGVDQPGGAQPGDGLADHGARHAVGLGERGLGRQLVAGAQPAVEDLRLELLDEGVREAPRVVAVEGRCGRR
jgi:hypothetical protein